MGAMPETLQLHSLLPLLPRWQSQPSSLTEVLQVFVEGRAFPEAQRLLRFLRHEELEINIIHYNCAICAAERASSWRFCATGETKKNISQAMPGKWVGGRGSLAAPTKGQFIEANVFDPAGKGQGTIILHVKRLFGTGTTGRTILADLVTATDEYYRHWVTTEEGAPTTVDGSYHLCKGDAATCTGGGGEHLVHLGKWRTWTEAELVAGNATSGNKGAEEMLMRFFKEVPRGAREERPGGLPWGLPGLALKGKIDKDEENKKRKAKEAGDDEKQKKRERLTRLEDELKKLRDELGSDEEPPAREQKKEKEKREKRDKSPRKENPLEKFKTGLMRKDDKESSGSSDDSSSSEEDVKEVKKKEIEKKAAKAAKEKAKKAKEKAKKDKKKEKKDKKKAKKQKDRGPFGVAPSEHWDDVETKGDSSSESSDSDQSFQKAPSSTTHHMKLVRYAKRHPGRLAARLVRKMQAATGFGGGAETKPEEKSGEVRAVAHMYFLAVMTPALRDRWSPRTQRELKICTSLLDLMVLGKGPEVADILAQRVKALEKSVQDNNQWRRAKHLELIEGEDAALVDQGEESMMMKEAEREDKLRRGSNWTEGEPWRKGKGKVAPYRENQPRNQGGGKAKGKKGTPAEKAAAKKDEPGAP
eukprot:s619_g5.t1